MIFTMRLVGASTDTICGTTLCRRVLHQVAQQMETHAQEMLRMSFPITDGPESVVTRKSKASKGVKSIGVAWHFLRKACRSIATGPAGGAPSAVVSDDRDHGEGSRTFCQRSRVDVIW